MRQRRPLLMFALALLCLSLAACGAKQYPMQITVVNRSTYPIADIRISLNPEEGWGENRLETTLEEGESAGIDLGEYTEEQLSAGFHFQFYGEGGQPVNPDSVSYTHLVKLADWDTMKSNVFAKTAIRFVQGLPEARLLKSVVVPFESETLGK